MRKEAGVDDNVPKEDQSVIPFILYIFTLICWALMPEALFLAHLK
jgi:hypothetical protein